MLVTTTNQIIPVSQIKVSDIYQQLVGENWLQIAIESSRNQWIINTIKWENRWKYLLKSQHLTPKDKEFKHKQWIGKLWTGSNRPTNENGVVICPICNKMEHERNHPLGTKCNLSKNIFKKFREIWRKWTNGTHLNQSKSWFKKIWNLDWSSDYEYGNQIDFVITSLKRKLWNNYTKCLFGGISSTIEELWEIWINDIKWNLKSMIIRYQNNPQQLVSWKLNGSWLIEQNSNFQINIINFG